MKTTLYFIRHGYSTANVRALFVGHLDVPLTEQGQEQARRTAEYVAQFPLDALYSSDLLRARQTAEPIAELTGLEPILERDLREYFFGDLEGVPFPEYEKTNPEFCALWAKDFSRLVPPGGERPADLLARATRVLERIARENEGKVVAIVTHGVFLRAVHTVLTGGDLGAMGVAPWASNASVTRAEWEDGVFTLCEYGHDAHIADIRTMVEHILDEEE